MLLASKLQSVFHRGISVKSIYPASLIPIATNAPIESSITLNKNNNYCILANVDIRPTSCSRSVRSSLWSSYPITIPHRQIHGQSSPPPPPHSHPNPTTSLPPYIHDFEFFTLVEMQQKACKHFKEKPLFGTKYRDSFQWMNYKEFNHQVASMRYVLEKHNITKHDRVAIISNNRVEWAVAMYATMSMGAQAVPLYESQQEKDWKYILEDCRAKLLLVASEKIREKVKWYPENVGCVENILVMDRDDNCMHNLPR